MNRKHQSHRRAGLPSPAMIVAIAALILAAGGTAFAITKAPRGSVVSQSIRDGAVRSSDVKDESLTGADIAESTLRLEQGPASEAAAIPASLPPSGPASGSLTGQYPHPTIAPNAIGGAEVADHSIRGPDVDFSPQLVEAASAMSTANYKIAQASCPTNKTPIGLGYRIATTIGSDVGKVLVSSDNLTADQEHVVEAIELQPTAGSWQVIAQTTCLDID